MLEMLENYFIFCADDDNDDDCYLNIYTLYFLFIIKSYIPTILYILEAFSLDALFPISIYLQNIAKYKYINKYL